MSWNYRIIKHDKDAEVWYGLHEVYYDDKDNVDTWTEDPVDFSCYEDEGESGIVKGLAMALSDALLLPALKESELLK